MRVDNFSYSSADEKLSDWLGNHYQFEVFTPGQKRLENLIVPLVNKIKTFKVPTTIIGGTNGKGEVSLLLEEVALRSDIKPLLWTSPHIVTVRERFCFNGKMIEADVLLNLFIKNEAHTKVLSFYEFLFYCFCEYSIEFLKANEGPFVIILEVGLGGRLDATNLFDADVSCLTSVGRDHIEVLGKNLSNILKEKIAISRPHKDLVIGIDQKVLIKQAEKYCLDNNINIHGPAKNDNTQVNFKLTNLYLAKQVWPLLIKKNKINPTAILRLDSVSLWGRPLVVTDSEHTFTLLGTHNLDGLRSLSKVIASSGKKPSDEIWVALTRSRESEISTFLTLLSTLKCLGKKVLITSFDHPRATSLDKIKRCVGELLKMEHIELDAEWDDRIKNKKIYKSTIVVGSYFFIGEVFRCLLSHDYYMSKD